MNNNSTAISRINSAILSCINPLITYSLNVVLYKIRNCSRRQLD